MTRSGNGSGPVAFYAPLKAPDHPTPSGDRRMARLLMRALAEADLPVELACHLRSYDRAGNPARQRRLEAIGAGLAGRLARRIGARAADRRPRAWLTYHPYHKSPDWLGPAVAPALDLPYLQVEASFAPKQAGGPWAVGHRAAGEAIRAAHLVLALTRVDMECLAPLIAPPAELWHLPPFLDPAPFAIARQARDRHRASLTAGLGLDPALPWLLVVAMMRGDVKRQSYLVLVRALATLGDLGWQLIVVGDGPARPEIEVALAGLGPDRVKMVAGIVPEDELPGYYAAADLYVWPALREAYGLAMLEAQAAGVPVVAGDDGGVAEVLEDGASGVLTRVGDPDALAAAVRHLLQQGDTRRAMGDRAHAFVAERRSLGRTAERLATAVAQAAEIHARRPWPAC